MITFPKNLHPFTALGSNYTGDYFTLNSLYHSLLKVIILFLFFSSCNSFNYKNYIFEVIISLAFSSRAFFYFPTAGCMHLSRKGLLEVDILSFFLSLSCRLPEPPPKGSYVCLGFCVLFPFLQLLRSFFCFINPEGLLHRICILFLEYIYHYILLHDFLQAYTGRLRSIH